MEANRIMQIIQEASVVRTGGSPEELHCARYLQARCAELGLEARLEPFPVEMGSVQRAELWCDGVQIPCTGYNGALPGDVEAPLYYLSNTDPWSLEQCRGKIVLSDKLMSYWHYHDLVDHGALGFITYNGDLHYADEDLEQRELRSYVREDKPIPGVHLHAKQAVPLIERGVARARLVLENTIWEGESQNVVLDLPGETEEFITFTAHYDSTPLSVGAWDNMSGSVGLLALAEHFASHPHRYGLRFVWCGTEERGLLGSKAYCKAHAEELEKCVLNINLDMIGTIMGKFLAYSTAEEKLVHYVSYLAMELGFGMESHQGVYSSDSTPFADTGVPAITFARMAPGNVSGVHNRNDTIALLKGEQMVKDIAFIAAFADRMANAKRCPVTRVIPENMKTKLDEYLNRKRPK